MSAVARLSWAALAVLAALSLAACKPVVDPTKPAVGARALVTVNDVDIAMPDSPGELKVDKRMVEQLIDRQVLQEEALRNKLDRDPLVRQAIERERTRILADAYLQSKLGAQSAPGQNQIDSYFNEHPELFGARKLFVMQELVVASKDLSAPLTARVETAHAIEQVAAWLDAHHVHYERNQWSRTTAELAPELVLKLQAMHSKQLCVIKAGQYSMVDFLVSVSPSPVSKAAAHAQIAQYLSNKMRQQIGEDEVARLRKGARIVYLNNNQDDALTLRADQLIATPPRLAARQTDVK